MPTADQLVHEQLERGQGANRYESQTYTAGPPEPVAYLTMGMEFAKASSTFLDAIGSVSVLGRKLSDLIVHDEVERIFHLQNQLSGEQKRREPNYLPPILGHSGQAIQGVGFSTTEVTRFPMIIQEQLTFIGPDGYARPHTLRLGLGKEGSFFFVIMLLNKQHRNSYPQTLNLAATSYHAPPSPRTALARAPSSAHFNPVRNRLGESFSQGRSPLSLQDQRNRPTGNAGMGGQTHAAATAYGPSTDRNAYQGPSPGQPFRDVGRSETSCSVGQMLSQNYQLPPIRRHSENEAFQGQQGRPRDDRYCRVDIRGLIDKPEESDEPR
ncbi:hypothetical protein DCS_00471 [Drechmeria coniospora]|uniref:Uncharacterized protein n=1 Tax=Drechmeria coniospora TaxID=98403 RepID=A0A151GQK5_DRECN|nr:hypothetical protein DCS_00471 [Drechmeria coniospora]KYK59341.1 hypothetical protein DCS_00471 [Drechmeria coniospora]